MKTSETWLTYAEQSLENVQIGSGNVAKILIGIDDMNDSVTDDTWTLHTL